MRILVFFFSLLVAMLLCLSAIACKLFVVTARDVPPPTEARIVTLHAQMQPVALRGLSLSSLPCEEPEETKELSTLTTPAATLTSREEVLPTSAVSDKEYYVTVTVNGTQTHLSLHDYLVGVLLAELPMGFCEDARYAQAVAARSYVIHCVERGMKLGPTSCAYFTEEKAKSRYKHLYDAALLQAETAVTETDGILMIYGEDVCMAAFHAMSYDKTEASGEVWNEDMPYLVPVTTPEDIELGGMQTEYTFTQRELSALLGGKCQLPMSVTLTDGGRVECVTFASGDSYAGTLVRTALSLRSTAFTVTKQSLKGVTLEVVGYGHGVGMSQWGAQMMALDGCTWQEILLHYYKGVSFDTLASRVAP